MRCSPPSRAASAGGTPRRRGNRHSGARTGAATPRVLSRYTIYKIYAESFRDEAHLEQILAEAGAIVAGA